MLVLSRKSGESFVICGHEDFRITITKIERGQVFIGFDAPKDVVIFREELLKQEVKNELRSLEQDGAGFQQRDGKYDGAHRMFSGRIY